MIDIQGACELMGILIMYISVISQATRMLVQQIVHVNTEQNSLTYCITGPLWGESIGPRWIPHTKGQ